MNAIIKFIVWLVGFARVTRVGTAGDGYRVRFYSLRWGRIIRYMGASYDDPKRWIYILGQGRGYINSLEITYRPRCKYYNKHSTWKQRWGLCNWWAGWVEPYHVKPKFSFHFNIDSRMWRKALNFGSFSFTASTRGIHAHLVINNSKDFNKCFNKSIGLQWSMLYARLHWFLIGKRRYLREEAEWEANQARILEEERQWLASRP